MSFAVGAAVDGNYHGEGEWFSGRVAAVDAGARTYHIKYDDGDEELGVTEGNLRRPLDFAEGTLVQADYQAEGEYFDGTIAFAHGNGLYNIAYVDGDFEENVPKRLIRLRTDAASTATTAAAAATTLALTGMGAGASGADAFAAGTRVEGNFAGNGEWFPGTVAAVQPGPPATYDIAYDDGDAEHGVTASLVRPIQVAAAHAEGSGAHALEAESAAEATSPAGGSGAVLNEEQLGNIFDVLSDDGTLSADNLQTLQLAANLPESMVAGLVAEAEQSAAGVDLDSFTRFFMQPGCRLKESHLEKIFDA